MRPAYSGLGKGVPNPVVCGRKFCSKCGRWRPVSDFRPWPWHKPRVGSGIGRKPSASGLSAACVNCGNRARREQRQAWTPERVALEAEYHRFYSDARRRRAGARRYQRRRASVVDRIEKVGLPVEPIARELARLDDGDFATLAARADVSERALYRYRYGESRHVRIDIADRVALALGLSLFELYGDAPVEHLTWVKAA
jgi:hypothetical protein